MTDDNKPDGTPQSWTWGQNKAHILFTHDVTAGMSAHQIVKVVAGLFPDDVHMDKLAIILENAPGDGRTVTVTISDGTTTMTVNVVDAEISGSTTTNNFDWDVSATDATMDCSTSGGTAAGAMTVVVFFHKITM